MIDFKEATKLANNKLAEIEGNSRIKLALLMDEVVEFEFGWMYFYQSYDYVMYGNEDFLIGGNSPIIVDKYFSKAIITGSRYDYQYYIDAYKKFREKPELFIKAIS